MVEPRPRRGPIEFRRLATSRRIDYLLDQVHYVTKLFAKSYFRNDPLEEFDHTPLSEIIRDYPPRPPRETDEGWKVTVRMGDVQRTARVHWRRPPQKGRPVIIYHHGGGSIPYDKAFDRIIPAHFLPEWNVGCIQAASHRSVKIYFRSAFDSLLHMQLLFASSVQALESVSKWAVRNGAPRIVYCGVSIGGIVAALHMCLFGSAGLYLPMLAGLDAHHLFFGGSNRSLTHKAKVRGRLECYRDALDFRPLIADAPRRPCFPLLARHDVMMDYRRSRRTWKGYPVTVIERGHSTGVFSYQALTEHVMTHLPSV